MNSGLLANQQSELTLKDRLDTVLRDVKAFHGKSSANAKQSRQKQPLLRHETVQAVSNWKFIEIIKEDRLRTRASNGRTPNKPQQEYQRDFEREVDTEHRTLEDTFAAEPRSIVQHYQKVLAPREAAASKLLESSVDIRNPRQLSPAHKMLNIADAIQANEQSGKSSRCEQAAVTTTPLREKIESLPLESRQSRQSRDSALSFDGTELQSSVKYKTDTFTNAFATAGALSETAQLNARLGQLQRELDENQQLNTTLLEQIQERERNNQQLQRQLDMQDIELAIQAKEKQIELKKRLKLRKKEILQSLSFERANMSRPELRVVSPFAENTPPLGNHSKLANYFRVCKQRQTKTYHANFESQLQIFERQERTQRSGAVTLPQKTMPNDYASYLLLKR